MSKLIKLLLALFCTITATASIVLGAQEPAVMNAQTTGESITLFLKASGYELSHIYINNEECTNYTTQEMGPVRNVVIVDNSLSIRSEYRDGIKAFLKELVAARKDGDTFTIATFAKDISYLTQDSNDYLDISGKIDALNFTDQETFFSKTLYDVLSNLENSQEGIYTRIIVIADGVDNETLGYTESELHQKIQEAAVPIYSIGCTSGNNEEALKNMFSLSRLSNAKSFSADAVSFPQILQEILNDTDLIRITLTPPDELCDGSVQNVRLSLGDTHCTVQAEMPFKELEQPETEGDIPETTEDTPEETVEEVPENKMYLLLDKLPLILIGVAIAAAVIGILCVIIALILKRKRPAKGTENSLSQWNSELDDDENGDGNFLQEAESLDTAGSGDVTCLIGEAPSVKLCLQDIKDRSKTFEYPIRDRVLIGRDASRCQIVIDYSRYVSAVHCEILPKGDSYIVRDGGDSVIASKNGTFVNDRRAAPELPLPSGAVLRLGVVSFKVTYR